MRGFIRGVGVHGFVREGACVVLFREGMRGYSGGVHGFIWGGMHGFIWGGGMCGFFSFFQIQ